jgi:serine protease Do
MPDSALPTPAPRGAAVLAAAATMLVFAFAPGGAQARLPGESFAPLVQQVSSAVVNIAAIREVAGRDAPAQGAIAPGSPMEEFLRRFGAPLPQRERPDAQPRRATALGSGFVIDPAGYVVTNNHVVADAKEIAVTFADGRQLNARLVGRDDKTDLALIKVESAAPLPAVAWGDSDRVQVGDWVLAVGNPFGLGGTVTAGIVSARGRDIQAGPYDDFLQLDAPINQGNSGGPAFDMSGRVIGVNTAIYSPNGGSVGIGFAIPAAVARPVIDALRETGRIERGWIGVSVQPLTPDLATGLGLATGQDGALVAQLEPNGPAARAGLRQGDVVVAIDGRPVNRLRDLPRAIAAVKPGATASVDILRRGTAMQVPVVVGSTRAAERAARAAAPQPTSAEPLGRALRLPHGAG